MAPAEAASAGRGGSGGGTAGTTGSGGSGGTGSTTVPSPSAGCGKSGRPSGGKVEVAGQSLHYFPTSYDGTKPFPLLIALHACGNPNTEFVSLTTGNGLDTTYVRTFPNTPDSGQCWSNYTGDVARILSQYDDLMANYCIDKNRVFAIGPQLGRADARQHPLAQDRRAAPEPQGRRRRWPPIRTTSRSRCRSCTSTA